jgi:DNA-binding NarL/FixJ family response regulator
VRSGLVDLINNEADLEVCGEAADAPSALRMVSEKKPDLVVIDLTLREGSGLELIKQIRALDGGVRMVVSSMHDERLFAERVLGAGAMGYVNKQEPAEKLLDAIRQTLNGRVYVSEQIAERVLQRVSRGSTSKEASPLQTLSDRELEVLNLIGEGLSTREIAEHLHLSVKTIDTYREHLKAKLGLKSANELVRYAVMWSLDPESERETPNDGAP